MTDIQAVGYGVDVADNSNLGYIETTAQAMVTGVGVSSLAVSALDRAEQVWRSYARDDTHDTLVLQRAATAAYYYGMESMAEELLRLRIGNIGAAANSSVAEIIVNKAMSLLGTAQAGIRAYEEYCANEAKVVGAKVTALVSDASVSLQEGLEAAQAHWGMVANDGLTGADRAPLADDTKFIAGIGYAYSMQLLGAKVIQRQLGYSGARNPAIGRFYLNAGQSLVQSGSAIIQRFTAWSAAAKPQHTIMAFGI